MVKEELFNALLPNRKMSYQEAIKELPKLKQQSFSILEKMRDLYDTYFMYVGTSGGKDSVVVHNITVKWLSKYGHTNPSLVVIHTTKPNEVHPLTKEFLYSRPYIIRYVPKDLHVKHVNQFTGGTCIQIDGSRIAESDRDERSTTFVSNGEDISRENMQPIIQNGLFGFTFVYPILYWYDEHVWAYILSENIEFSQEYLVEAGIKGYTSYA